MNFHTTKKKEKMAGTHNFLPGFSLKMHIFQPEFRAGAYPKTFTLVLTDVTLSYILKMTNNGYRQALREAWQNKREMRR